MVGDAKSFSLLTPYFDSVTIVGDSARYWPEWPYWRHKKRYFLHSDTKLFMFRMIGHNLQSRGLGEDGSRRSFIWHVRLANKVDVGR